MRRFDNHDHMTLGSVGGKGRMLRGRRGIFWFVVGWAAVCAVIALLIWGVWLVTDWIT